MPIPVRSPKNFLKNEIQNALVHPLASPPGSATEAQIYYDTVDNTFGIYDGTRWVYLGTLDQILAAEADVDLNSHKLVNVTNPTNPQDASTRSWTLALKVTDLTAPTGNFDMNSHKITSVLDPTSAQDVATQGWTLALDETDLTAIKAYVDSQVGGARDVKDAMRLATAAALPAYSRTGNVLTASGNGALSVDSVAVAVNDRVLVNNDGSATGADRGLYSVTATGDAGNPWVLTRTSDADVSAEVTQGMFVWVTAGSSLAGRGYLLTTADPITLNTTALSFTVIATIESLLAGAGLTKTGATIDVIGGATPGTGGNGGGVVVNANDVVIDTGVVARWVSGDCTDQATQDFVHGLGNQWCQVTVTDKTTPFSEQEVEIRHKDANTVTLVFSPTAPTTAQFRVTCIG